MGKEVRRGGVRSGLRVIHSQQTGPEAMEGELSPWASLWLEERRSFKREA